MSQCLRILRDYPIVLVAPIGLDVAAYNAILGANFSCHYFHKKYFSSINGYNKLMMSNDFYSRLSSYDYILIYQLDAYVFKDELISWCKLNYDYIGAPWFDGFHKNTTLSFAGVGNGGFSLRRVKAFINVINDGEKLLHQGAIFASRSIKLKSKALLYLSKIIRRITFNRWKIPFAQLFVENEDYVFGIIFSKENKVISTPSPLLAAKFAFEMNPSFLYKQNEYSLPFGCHGWYKHEQGFWSSFINFEGNTN